MEHSFYQRCMMLNQQRELSMLPSQVMMLQKYLVSETRASRMPKTTKGCTLTRAWIRFSGDNKRRPLSLMSTILCTNSSCSSKRPSRNFSQVSIIWKELSFMIPKFAINRESPSRLLLKFQSQLRTFLPLISFLHLLSRPRLSLKQHPSSRQHH